MQQHEQELFAECLELMDQLPQEPEIFNKKAHAHDKYGSYGSEKIKVCALKYSYYRITIYHKKLTILNH